eukprot:tig00020610_g11954.t1
MSASFVAAAPASLRVARQLPFAGSICTASSSRRPAAAATTKLASSRQFFGASTTFRAAVDVRSFTATAVRTMTTKAEKQVLVPITDGSEEIESCSIINILVRAGIKVTVAKVPPKGATSSDSLQILGSRGIKIVADKHLSEVAGEHFDLIALPGGMPGAEHLRDSSLLKELLAKQKDAGKPIAAICASPAVVFASHQFVNSKKVTGYPADKFKEALAGAGGSYQTEGVVVDGNVITSQGPGTAIPFALRLIEVLAGADKSREIAKQLLVDPVC